MDDGSGAGDVSGLDVDGLLAGARHAGPAHRIEWRDRIAAHGEPAIEAITPWLGEPKFAAFAIRVIERAGQVGDPQREVALRVLRGARRTIDPCVSPDLEWAVLRLRAPAPSEAPATPRAVPPARVRRSEKPRGVGRMVRASY
jgi:hypothetical protein